MRVLVVDDSVVFRSQIKAALEGVAGVEVVGVANNGKIALQKLAQSSVDLITLDMEMPEMGGIETIKEIKKAKFPVRIIVFSAHTTRGSEAALEALTAGADDFVAKPAGEDLNYENAASKIREELIPKITQFFPNERKASTAPSPTIAARPALPTFSARDLATFRPSVIVIGSSTGGPPALEKVLKEFSLPYQLPILIVQHMPPVFTASLAKRLQETTGMPACEATDMMEIKNNHIYVAPGDYHMSVKKAGEKKFLSLDQSPQRNSVRPAVDILFESAAEHYGYRTMGVVLTGMGEDGLIGARAIKEKGGGVMIQNKESCVVFGMPGAIFAAGFQDGMGDLVEINTLLRKYGV